MTDFNLPREAVEAAAKVIAENTDEPGWSAVVIARAALTAAGPIIAAEVRRAPDGCAWCCASNPPGVKPGSDHDICPAQRDRIAEHPCGDYPAPCNCDDPETHDGAVPAAEGDAVLDRAAAAFADAWTGVATLREGVRAALTAAGPIIAAEVRGQREAFLPSDTLDPAWIAGWHAAVDHVAAALADWLRGADDPDTPVTVYEEEET